MKVLLPITNGRGQFGVTAIPVPMLTDATKLTAAELRAAVVAIESVTAVPKIAATVVPGAMPAPDTNCPMAILVPLATVRAFELMAAVPVVVATA